MDNGKRSRGLPPQSFALFYCLPIDWWSSKQRGSAPSLRIFCYFYLPLSIFLFLIGCGAPGEPTPPSPQIPVAIKDLEAHQAGDTMQLSFTLPSKTIRGELLSETPAVEILRGAAKADGSVDAKSFRVVQTIPGALVDSYRADDRVQVTDNVPAEELRTNNGRVAYRMRTRASRKRASADSNTVVVRIVPTAERITSPRATPTESAIELTWAPPSRTFDGEPLGPITEYRIYRGEIDPPSADAASKDLSQAKWKSPLSLIGRSTTPDYRDTDFQFGKTYVYTVRTATQADDNPVESGDSTPAVITPQDIYPPATPQGLVATVIVGEPTKQPEVDLSWSISSETDLAGYRVYRSEQQETRGEMITPELLLSPAYRDTSVQPGHTYWYRVTAVDRAGNESAPSAPVAADVTQPSL